MSGNSLRWKRMFIPLLVCSIFTEYCDSLPRRDDASDESRGEGRGRDGSAFLALPSCHQVLRGDSGEFFSPDYLCSNPPLWCNWTIQVHPGKRVRLYLIDYTPADVCHLKTDQIHVDEPLGISSGHNVLDKCWDGVQYTSLSNVLHIVLLMPGSPYPPHRGFYGRYQAFDTNAEHPLEYTTISTLKEPKVTRPPTAQRPFTKFVTVQNGEPTDAVFLENPTHTHTMYNYLAPARSNELPTEKEELVGAEQDTSEWDRIPNAGYPSAQELGNYSEYFEQVPRPLKESTQQTLRSGTGAAHTLSQSLTEKRVQQSHPSGFLDNVSTEPSPRIPSAMHRNIDSETALATSSLGSPDHSEGPANSLGSSEQSEDVSKRTWVINGSEEPSPPVDTPAPPNVKCADPNPLSNVFEALLDSGLRAGNTRNHTVGHQPGDHLFEVAVEVSFPAESEELWDQIARSLLMSIKAMLHKLEILNIPKTISSKRIKRLSAGTLYIFWLQISDTPDGWVLHQTLHAALQGLVGTVVRPGGSHVEAVLVSVSTADINECGTQLVLCDINAVCVNHFGSYACHCRPGFKDVSTQTSAGTHCIDLATAGCDSGLSAGLVKGIYGVCFLLGSLLLLLLVTAAVIYRRRHNGAFPIRCQSSSLGSLPYPTHGTDNKEDCGSILTNAELPPPPPPIRRPREGWSHHKDCCQPVDLQLLRFSPLLPLDGYIGSEERVKM